MREIYEDETEIRNWRSGCIYAYAHMSMWVPLYICVFYDLTLKAEYCENGFLVDKGGGKHKRREKWRKNGHRVELTC